MLDDHNHITVLLFLAAQEGDAVSVADYAPFVDDIDARDDEDCTPLYCAVGSQCLEAVRVLLNYGASPNCRNKSGGLLFDMVLVGNDLEMARLLVRGGADLALTSGLDSRTLFEIAMGLMVGPEFRALALEWAVENAGIFEKVPHAVHLAIDYCGVDLLVAKLVNAGCPLSAVDTYDKTPLVKAVHEVLPESVGAMLRRGVDTAIDDPEGFNIAWHLIFGSRDQQDKVIQIARMLFDYCPSAFELILGEKRLSEGLRLMQLHEVADFVARECES